MPPCGVVLLYCNVLFVSRPTEIHTANSYAGQVTPQHSRRAKHSHGLNPVLTTVLAVAIFQHPEPFTQLAERPGGAQRESVLVHQHHP